MLKVIVLTVCASLAVANVHQARSSQPSPVGMQATKDEASKEEVVNPLIVGVLKHLAHDDFNLKKRVEKLEHEASVVSPVVAEAPETGAGVDEPMTAEVEDPTMLLQETTTTNNLRTNKASKAMIKIKQMLAQKTGWSCCFCSCPYFACC